MVGQASMHGARREGPVTRLVALGLELTIGREGPHPRRRHLQDTRYLRGRVGLLLHSRYPTLNPSLAACRKQTLMRVGPQLREIYPYRGLQRHRTIQHHGRMKASMRRPFGQATTVAVMCSDASAARRHASIRTLWVGPDPG